MKKLLFKLWQDQDGFVVSTELILIATILVIGMIVGLATVRNAVVQELGDVAMAVGSINQSYSYTGVTGREIEPENDSSFTAGSMFADMTDFCDGDGEDEAGQPPAGISVTEDPVSEENDT